MILWIIFIYGAYKAIEYIWDRIRFKNVNPGTVVLITGGSTGLGKELGLLYASYKCKIVIWDVADQDFDTLKQEIESRGGSCLALKCDISKKDQVSQAAARTLESYGKVDIVINNAAVANNMLFENLTETRIQKIFDVNVIGQAFVTKQFLHSAKQFIFISSIMSKFTSERGTDYCATKHAIDGMFNSLRLEFKRAKKNAKILLVHPYHIKTRMFEGFMCKNASMIKSLETNDVARAIYNAACLGKLEIYLPFYLWHLFIIFQILPISFADMIANNVFKDALANTKPSYLE
jgi:short-subunit dehydrogenase